MTYSTSRLVPSTNCRTRHTERRDDWNVDPIWYRNGSVVSIAAVSIGIKNLISAREDPERC